ncbi:CDC27 family protein [Rugamonas sp. DEMB1]|uniref:tetratricopeptide repeat protein n=1 Tax=Rugamonas sp. DEMB1 TaxID=3039386 RepID=UPI0028BE7EF0|nr:CDC27 family protein [Rugamonas sp. DEMB1]
MSKFRLAHLGLVMAAIGFTAAAPLVGLGSIAHAADAVRAEVGKPLQEAQKLAQAGKNKEALAKLKEADAVGGKSPNEVYLIERTRASAAAAAGDNDAAAHAFEAVINSGKLSAAEAPKFTQALAGIYYRAKDYPKAITWIQRSLKDGENPQMRELLIQTYYISGKYAEAAKELQGKGNSEAQLQMLANIQLKQNDKAGYVQTLEKLAGSYPKTSYWADLLNRVTGKPGFSGTLSLDVLRLKLANGLLSKPGEYMEMSQLALQSGNGAEALKIIDQGYKKGVLGVGSDAARHQRLKGPGREDRRRRRDPRRQAGSRTVEKQGRRRPEQPGLRPGQRRQGRQGPGADDAGDQDGRRQASGPFEAAPGHRPGAGRQETGRPGDAEGRQGHRRRGRPGALLDAANQPPDVSARPSPPRPAAAGTTHRRSAVCLAQTALFQLFGPRIGPETPRRPLCGCARAEQTV